MLEKETGWESGKCCVRGLEASQASEEYFLFCLVHPSPLLLPLNSHHPWRIQGAFYKWEKAILLTWDQTMRKVVNNPSSFMFLFWGRVEFWGVWAERKERIKSGHILQSPNSLQSPYTVLFQGLDRRVTRTGTKDFISEPLKTSKVQF